MFFGYHRQTKYFGLSNVLNKASSRQEKNIVVCVIVVGWKSGESCWIESSDLKQCSANHISRWFSRSLNQLKRWTNKIKLELATAEETQRKRDKERKIWKFCSFFFLRFQRMTTLIFKASSWVKQKEKKINETKPPKLDNQ